MAEPKAPDGWNVAEMAGGLLLSADGFVLQIDDSQLDAFVAALNLGGVSEIKDANGDVVTIELLDDDVILTRVNDKIYPHGIILPIDAFTEFEDDPKAPILEGVKAAFRRAGRKIKRGYRVTSGRRKGRVVVNPATANKPPINASTRRKLSIAGKRKTFIRALKAKMTRRKSASIRLRRMNNT